MLQQNRFSFGARALAIVTAATFSLGATSCIVEEQEEDLPAPEFQPDQGQPASGAIAYPSGPYGVGKESVVSNYKFVGFANPSVPSETMESIQLADFYNPTGEEVYPEGSPYGEGNPKPTALLIVISASWCGPCQIEAKDVLPGKRTKYRPMGGEFLLQLADGPTPGKAAEPKHLVNWTNKFKVDYPSTIDPSYKLGALTPAAAYPTNMIISTRTMKIIEAVSGSPTSAFWSKFEKTMSGALQ